MRSGDRCKWLGGAGRRRVEAPPPTASAVYANSGNGVARIGVKSLTSVSVLHAEERLLGVVERTFRRVKTQQGHAPDVADIRQDLAPALRLEILLVQLREVRSFPVDRERRVAELIREISDVALELFKP